MRAWPMHWPRSRPKASARSTGTALQSTLINCFVQPVGDCIQGQDDGGYPGI